MPLAIPYSRLRPTRPLSNAHWSLPAALLVIWEFVLFARQCKEGPFYLEACLAVATIGLVLWTADLRRGPTSGLRRAGKVVASVIYDLLALFLLFIIFGFLIAIVTPTYQCYTPRAKVAELVLAGSPYRAEITNRAEKLKSLKGAGEGLSVRIEGRVRAGFVSDDGAIVVASEEPLAVVLLRPTIKSGVVSWKCMGFPLNLMPTSCRELPSF